MTYLEERNPGIGEDQVLEALLTTKDRIERTWISWGDPDAHDRPRWNFDDWTSCTCGHIYTVATGVAPPPSASVTSPRKVDGLYEEVLKAVARANPAAVASYTDHMYQPDPDDPFGGDDVLAEAVSAATTFVSTELARAEADERARSTGLAQVSSVAEETRRRAALLLIDNTIEQIRRGHEQARRQLVNDSEAAGEA